jgi:hypothetical protein
MATPSASYSSTVKPLPFLLAGPLADDLDWKVGKALSAALAKKRAGRDCRRNTRGRVGYLLCELGQQLSRLRVDRDRDLPLSRVQIAEGLGVSLCRVKRALALLSLSQVIATDGYNLRVLDWRRLCGVAGFDPGRLKLNDDDFESALITSDRDPRFGQSFTASGDPACFV